MGFLLSVLFQWIEYNNKNALEIHKESIQISIYNIYNAYNSFYKYSFNKFSLLCFVVLPPKSKDNLTKVPNTKHRKPVELLVRAVQETPKTYSLLLLHFVTHHAEVEGKFLFLNMSCTSEAEPRGPWAGTKLKDSSTRSSSFHGTRGHHISFQRRQATKNPTQFLPIKKVYKPHQGTAWHNYPKDSAVAHKPWW